PSHLQMSLFCRAFCLVPLPLPPSSPSFPYPTLFRSWLRSRRQAAIARMRHEVVQAIRDFFYERHFTLVDTPILTGAIGVSTRVKDRKSTRLNSSHQIISYAVFCLKKKNNTILSPHST